MAQTVECSVEKSVCTLKLQLSSDVVDVAAKGKLGVSRAQAFESHHEARLVERG